MSAKPSSGGKAGPGAGKQLGLALPPIAAEAMERLAEVAPQLMREFEAEFALTDAPSVGVATAGRPKGSLNKAKKEFRSYVLAVFGHPLIGTAMLGTWASFDEFVLKAQALQSRLGISAERAVDVLMTANARIAPYIEGQMPIRVDAKVAAGVTIQIGANMLHLPGAEPPA